MEGYGLLATLLIGLVAGWLASFVVGGGGLVKYLIWGVLGSFVGALLLPAIGLDIATGSHLVDTVLVSTLGAIVLVLVARIVS